MMDFLSFPLQLIKSVLLLLDFKSLKTTRLVSKQFSNRATPLLFANIEVWFQKTSLARLVSIAKDVNLSQHVRSLTITNDFVPTDILEPSGFIFQLYIKVFAVKIGTQRPPRTIVADIANSVTLEEFLEAGFKDRLALRKQFEDASWSAERLYSTWQRHRDISIEQAKLMTSNVDVKSLTIALKNCQNLEIVRLTGGTGLGGIEKLSRNSLGETVIYGPIYRADGRQITAFLEAAARLSAITNRTPHGKFSSLIMEHDYWEELEDKYTYDKTYIARVQGHQPHFGSISASTIISALPFLASIKTLGLSLPSKNGERDMPNIESNLAIFLAGLPDLHSLTLHNPNSDLVSLERPFHSIVSTSIHTLKIQNCVVDMSTMKIFLSSQASTLSTIHLENIALLGGHYLEFLSTIRNTVQITEFVTKGWLVELYETTYMYGPDDGYDEEEVELINERRERARRIIVEFVQREREDLPVNPRDEDSSDTLEGITVFIGETKFVGEDEY